MYQSPYKAKRQNVANTAWAFATVKYRDETLCAALARAAERRLSDFNPQAVANTAWALATVKYRDEKPFSAMARAAERRLSDFNPQAVANMAWAFATANYPDEKLFAALARAAERRLSDFNPSWIQMALWAFSHRKWVIVLRIGFSYAKLDICRCAPWCGALLVEGESTKLHERGW